MRNLWMYRSIEILVAGASEEGYWKSKGLPTSGRIERLGWGKSPKQAYRNALKNTTYVGNVDTTPVLGDSVYFLDGKEAIRTKYSDRLISSNGSLRV